MGAGQVLIVPTMFHVSMLSQGFYHSEHSISGD